MTSIVSRSREETLRFGYFLARKLRNGGALALAGTLGSGKTTLIKGIAQGLGIRSPIRSPSFVLVSAHKLPGKAAKTFYHFDLYRLKRKTELQELGFAEIVQNPNHILAIEWPEKAKKFLPANTIYLSFALGKHPHERVIKIWQKN